MYNFNLSKSKESENNQKERKNRIKKEMTKQKGQMMINHQGRRTSRQWR